MATAIRPQYLKKITTATVGLTPKICDGIVTDEVNKGQKVPVMRVYGVCRDQKQGTSNFGPYIKFGGEFEGVNLTTGEKFRAKALLLPPIAEMGLADTLQEAKAKNPDAFVEFGLDIVVELNPSKQGGWAFKYGCKPLKLDFTGENDQLSLMGASFGELPLLGAPTPKKKK